MTMHTLTDSNITFHTMSEIAVTSHQFTQHQVTQHVHAHNTCGEADVQRPPHKSEQGQLHYTNTRDLHIQLLVHKPVSGHSP